MSGPNVWESFHEAETRGRQPPHGVGFDINGWRFVENLAENGEWVKGGLFVTSVFEPFHNCLPFFIRQSKVSTKFAVKNIHAACSWCRSFGNWISPESPARCHRCHQYVGHLTWERVVWYRRLLQQTRVLITGRAQVCQRHNRCSIAMCLFKIGFVIRSRAFIRTFIGQC